MRACFLLTALLFCVSTLGCQTNSYTQRGSAVGGLGGAGLGALIGEIASDEPLAGAAIGGTIGALTGATVGTGLDEIDAANRAQVQQVAYQQERSGATLDEVISMSDAGLSDEIISKHVRNQGFYGALDAGDLIALRRQGVSDRVIADLQEMSSRPSRSVARAERVVSPPVIVEERYHTVPVFGHHRYHRAPICLPHRRPGFHWGVAFGH